MKINKLYYRDKVHNWTLEETSFDRLTLLVGASGVGKTRILKAIETLKNMAIGIIANGIEWNLEFEDRNNTPYTWKGETSIIEEKLSIFPVLSNDNKIPKSNIIKEFLIKDNTEIIRRSEIETTFNGQKMPKFSTSDSTISILKEEDLLKNIYQDFKNIYLTDYSSSSHNNGGIFSRMDIYPKKDFDEKRFSLKDIQELSSEIIVKLALVEKNCKSSFVEIKERYKEIFPQVEDVRITIHEINNDETLSLASINIKEKGIDEWITERNISSGMYRTLIHIAEMYLCADGTIFLIDEFENSLGINCIDELTDDILNSERQIQFIITSHHPYIINNIDFSHWKLVTRNGSKVRTTPVTNYLSGRSSHDKFMQLIQLKQYQTGQDN